jgi:predicted CopG family antitoxin
MNQPKSKQSRKSDGKVIRISKTLMQELELLKDPKESWTRVIRRLLREFKQPPVWVLPSHIHPVRSKALVEALKDAVRNRKSPEDRETPQPVRPVGDF